MNILLIDANSVQHVGNAALVDSTLQQLRGEFPQAQFAILAFDPPSIARLSGCRTIEPLWMKPFFASSKLGRIGWLICDTLWMGLNALESSLLRRIGLSIDPSKYTFSSGKLAALEAYSDADIVVSISGEMLQDAFWKRLHFFLYQYWLSHEKGKIMAIFPQSIGPIEKWYTKVLTKYVLNLCDLVLPRDYMSIKNVERLGIDAKKVYLVPDVAVNQPYVSSSEARELLRAEGVEFDRAPLIGMAISKWKEMGHEEYLLVMRKLCQFITSDMGGAVVLFSPNMPLPQELSDWQLAKILYESLPEKDNVILLSKTYTPREFKGMQGELDLFISTRMHASILATMIGTPTITVNTQPKLLGYMEMIGQQERSCEVSDFTFENAQKLIQDTLGNSIQIRMDLEKVRSKLGKQAIMASRLLKIVYEQRKKKMS